MVACPHPRRQPSDTTRAVPDRDLDELLRWRSVPLREKALWRMLSTLLPCSADTPEGGASAVMLQAKSRHRDLRTLGVYTRPGPEAVARLTDDQFDRG